jgi:hypothetical protein
VHYRITRGLENIKKREAGETIPASPGETVEGTLEGGGERKGEEGRREEEGGEEREANLALPVLWGEEGGWRLFPLCPMRLLRG